MRVGVGRLLLGGSCSSIEESPAVGRGTQTGIRGKASRAVLRLRVGAGLG